MNRDNNKLSEWDALLDQKNEIEGEVKNDFSEWDELLNIQDSKTSRNQTNQNLNDNQQNFNTTNNPSLNTASVSSTTKTIVGIVTFFLIIIVIGALFSNSGSNSNYSSSNTYSLTGESFKAGYSGSTYTGHTFSAKLTNTTNETRYYYITVRVFNSSGSQIASKSSSYTLQSRGTTNVNIFFPLLSNAASSYEVIVR